MASINDLRDVLARFPQKGFTAKRAAGDSVFAVKLTKPLPTLTGAALLKAAGTEGARLTVRETAAEGVDTGGLDKPSNSFAADTGALAAEAVGLLLKLKADAADPAPAGEPAAPVNRIDPHVNGTANGNGKKAKATA